MYGPPRNQSQGRTRNFSRKVAHLNSESNSNASSRSSRRDYIKQPVYGSERVKYIRKTDDYRGDGDGGRYPDFRRSKGVLSDYDCELHGSRGAKFYCHVSVLSLWSTVIADHFRARDRSQTAEDGKPLIGVIDLKDTDAVHLEEMLRVVYPPNKPVTEWNVLHLLPLARDLGMSDVKARCEECLLEMKPTLGLLCTAQDYRMPRLVDKCINKLAHVTFRILENDRDFSSLNLDVLMALLTERVRVLEKRHEQKVEVQQAKVNRCVQMRSIMHDIKASWRYQGQYAQEKRQEIMDSASEAITSMIEAGDLGPSEPYTANEYNFSNGDTSNATTPRGSHPNANQSKHKPQRRMNGKSQGSADEPMSQERSHNTKRRPQKRSDTTSNEKQKQKTEKVKFNEVIVRNEGSKISEGSFDVIDSNDDGDDDVADKQEKKSVNDETNEVDTAESPQLKKAGADGAEPDMASNRTSNIESSREPGSSVGANENHQKKSPDHESTSQTKLPNSKNSESDGDCDNDLEKEKDEGAPPHVDDEENKPDEDNKTTGSTEQKLKAKDNSENIERSKDTTDKIDDTNTSIADANQSTLSASNNDNGVKSKDKINDLTSANGSRDDGHPKETTAKQTEDDTIKNEEDKHESDPSEASDQNKDVESEEKSNNIPENDLIEDSETTETLEEQTEKGDDKKNILPNEKSEQGKEEKSNENATPTHTNDENENTENGSNYDDEFTDDDGETGEDDDETVDQSTVSGENENDDTVKNEDINKDDKDEQTGGKVSRKSNSAKNQDNDKHSEEDEEKNTKETKEEQTAKPDNNDTTESEPKADGGSISSHPGVIAKYDPDKEDSFFNIDDDEAAK